MSETKSYTPDRGDLVWVQFDPQAGHEQRGHRPAVVISRADYNRMLGLAQVMPVTGKSKRYPFEVPVPPGKAVTGVILADQLKSIDWRARQVEFADRVDDETINEAVGKVLEILDPDWIFWNPGAAE